MPSPTLYLDLETYCETPIKYGSHKYAEKSEILIFSYAFEENPVEVWDMTEDPTMPLSLYKNITNKYVDLCAHNSAFDRTQLEHSKRFAHHIKGHQWRDTMIRAFAHGLPGSLDKLSAIFALDGDTAKLKTGKDLIRLFCQPQTNRKFGKRATRETHPEEWAAFAEYAGRDIVAMRQLDKLLPKWNETEFEKKLWRLDIEINKRGFAVDTTLAKAAIEAVEKEKKVKDKRVQQISEGSINSATQRNAILKLLEENFQVYMPDLKASTIERKLSNQDLPPGVVEVLQLRLDSSKTSTTKYRTLINSVSSDKRLRGTLQFCGASRTGRWAGRIFQPQNLPRPTLKNWDVELGIRAIKGGYAEIVYDSVSNLASSALRGAIIAPAGRKLVVSDLSAIEGRVLAWLANEQWKLDAYRDFDLGLLEYDMYELTYAKTFNVDPAEVDKSMRQMGKVLELALGYGGGVGGLITFTNAFGIDPHQLAAGARRTLDKWSWDEAVSFYEWVTEGDGAATLPKVKKTAKELGADTFCVLDAIKRQWRAANPNIVNLWQALENGFNAVISNPKTFVTGGDLYGKHFVETENRYPKHLENSLYRIEKRGSWGRVVLPSGRSLCYAGLRRHNGTLKYLGLNQHSAKWCLISTYSGKLAENLTQAVARDVISEGAILAEEAGYEVILSVHDELLTETPDTKDYAHQKLSEIIATNPKWSAGLPLAAAGFEAKRYRKD